MQVDTVLHRRDFYLARLVRTAMSVEHKILPLAWYAQQDIIACRGQYRLRSISAQSVITAWSEQNTHCNIHVQQVFLMQSWEHNLVTNVNSAPSHIIVQSEVLFLQFHAPRGITAPRKRYYRFRVPLEVGRKITK